MVIEKSELDATWLKEIADVGFCHPCWSYNWNLFKYYCEGREVKRTSLWNLFMRQNHCMILVVWFISESDTKCFKQICHSKERSGEIKRSKFLALKWRNEMFQFPEGRIRKYKRDA
jgi:hypothetical protein